MVKVEAQVEEKPPGYQIFELESEKKNKKEELNQEKVEKKIAWRGKYILGIKIEYFNLFFLKHIDMTSLQRVKSVMFKILTPFFIIILFYSCKYFFLLI